MNQIHAKIIKNKQRRKFAEILSCSKDIKDGKVIIRKRSHDSIVFFQHENLIILSFISRIFQNFVFKGAQNFSFAHSKILACYGPVDSHCSICLEMKTETMGFIVH